MQDCVFQRYYAVCMLNLLFALICVSSTSSLPTHSDAAQPYRAQEVSQLDRRPYRQLTGTVVHQPHSGQKDFNTREDGTARYERGYVENIARMLRSIDVVTMDKRKHSAVAVSQQTKTTTDTTWSVSTTPGSAAATTELSRQSVMFASSQPEPSMSPDSTTSSSTATQPPPSMQEHGPSLATAGIGMGGLVLFGAGVFEFGRRAFRADRTGLEPVVNQDLDAVRGFASGTDVPPAPSSAPEAAAVEISEQATLQSERSFDLDRAESGDITSV